MNQIDGNSPPPHVVETVQAIARLTAEHHLTSTRSQRAVDWATSLLGQPAFLGVILIFVVFWVSANILSGRIFHVALDHPPFYWLEDGLTLMALFLAVLILSTQRRADQLETLRSQMTLELSILTEQKTTKLIELLEELRRDSPQVRDRVDAEASEMASRADPHEMLGAIEKTNSAIIASEKRNDSP